MAEKKITAVRTSYTKTQTVNALMESTGLARKEVLTVLDGLSDIIEGHIKKRSCGTFTVPGLIKLRPLKSLHVKPRKTYQTLSSLVK